MYVIRNNLKHPSTIFENAVFVVDVILFSIFALLAFSQDDLVPCIEFLVFVLGGIICLYFNNRAVAYVFDNEIIIRKFLKKYRYELKEIKFSHHDERQGKFELNFAGKDFSIPDIYLNSKKLISTLKIINNCFASQEGMDKLIQYFNEHASKKNFVLKPVKEKLIDLFTSKIGGVPYWDLAKEYPVDKTGKKMHLLCQLNFEECKSQNDLLPKKGILQFFIASSDNQYGMDFSEPSAQKNFRIVFHEKVDENIKEDEIIKLIPNESEITCSPILKSIALEFSQSISYMDINDYEIDNIIRSAVKEFTGKEADKDQNIFEIIGSEEENPYSSTFWNLVTKTESHVLGFPSFCQYDIRDEMPECTAEYYDTALLYLDSKIGDGEIMCWGDVGCADFLINSEALKNRDFSKVYYTWDCY